MRRRTNGPSIASTSTTSSSACSPSPTPNTRASSATPAAARRGAESKRYPWGDRLDRNMANFLVDPALKATHGTTPCRSYAANPLGLFDMAGNVWEWVYDWYDARYYGTAGARNPTGPPLGQLRLLRGGSWLVADVRMLSCSHQIGRASC